ncbi:MAG: hypothetical protein ACRELZ_23080 [Candidatus Rokuibacteriota bacterium]
MTHYGARSLRTILTSTVVGGLAALLFGCASAPVVVSDIKSVAGTWRGVIYSSGGQPERVELTIREDGSYDLVSRQTVGASRGKGKVVASEGRLHFQGEKGRGVGTVLQSPGGADRLMNIEATLSDNSILSAELSPSR